MEEAQVKAKLRNWIVKRAKTSPGPDFSDQTLILEERILSSLDVAEFVLYIESLLGEEVDVESLQPEVFASVDTIHKAFFGKA